MPSGGLREGISERVHVLLPASKGDVNLCKLLLGLSLLGYSTPTLLGWQQEFEKPGILGGGSHVAKVSKVLQYLESLPQENENDLVFMMDAYDIQIQLPQATLVQRYYSSQQAAQDRLKESMGRRTASRHNMREKILFGAGKRCAPNQPHTIACYPLPESPLPTDLYGANTDTVIGHNHWWSNRQRYLNSGYILGPAKDMKDAFREAWRRIEAHPEQDPQDDGSHGSDLMYHGSDQSIFAAMYGRQMWVREKLRLEDAGRSGKARSGSILGTRIDNILEPSVSHEHFAPNMSGGSNWWQQYEYGIFLDFWSDIGHQTINSEEDGKWITHSSEKSFAEQIGPRHQLDCPLRVPTELEEDVAKAASAVEDSDMWGWNERPLYTHLCTGRVPLLVHMNGIKGHREEHWPLMWYQPRSRLLLNDLMAQRGAEAEARDYAAHKEAPATRGPLGAWSDDEQFRPWSQICGPEYHAELFR